MIIKKAVNSIKHSKFFYECRNQTTTRKMMLNEKFIKYQEHKKWYLDSIKSNSYFLYIAYSQSKPVGTISFRADELFYNADVSVIVHENSRGKNFGFQILKRGIIFFFKNYRYNINLIARVKKRNKASSKIFIKNKFDLFIKNKKFLVYKKNAYTKNLQKKSNKIGLLIQARQTSVRLPNKVLKKINNHTLINILLTRLIRSKKINFLAVIIPKNKKNLKLFNFLTNSIYTNVFRGSENNVLKRYYDASTKYKLNSIVRVTADCPLLDHELLDDIISNYIKAKSDYASNVLPPSLPRGFSVEIFKYSTLKKTFINSHKDYEKEHVNYHMHENAKIIKLNYKSKIGIFSKKNLSVDNKQDMHRVRSIFDYFYPNFHFRLQQIKKKFIK
jgi:spore coat polysaccharide biosynthesis protein SpsF (cytidylyltransferase family)